MIFPIFFFCLGRALIMTICLGFSCRNVMHRSQMLNSHFRFLAQGIEVSCNLTLFSIQWFFSFLLCLFVLFVFCLISLLSNSQIL
ncbi:unnamed protein product [Musa acuminata subsp. malaccensis]|uniref:Uncharacterized protein n=1 Tax=Musa acuminata subsp. malaccensis TaxID=214687 RepID=A0A804U5R5_MUSAM|nr:unnamed protein product [Musa acuminata subsp. malaccensis]